MPQRKKPPRGGAERSRPLSSLSMRRSHHRALVLVVGAQSLDTRAEQAAGNRPMDQALIERAAAEIGRLLRELDLGRQLPRRRQSSRRGSPAPASSRSCRDTATRPVVVIGLDRPRFFRRCRIGEIQARRTDRLRRSARRVCAAHSSSAAVSARPIRRPGRILEVGHHIEELHAAAARRLPLERRRRAPRG